MQKTAIFWIRDGVLIDRMPVNAVAFALACLTHADDGASTRVNLTALVNFAFSASGISCVDKIHKFNREHFLLVQDPLAAAQYYDRLVGLAAARCEYFSGACALVESMQARGILNFITSAVEQTSLDSWAQSDQARPLVPHLTEIIGRRSNGFSKGREHFAYARDHYAVERIVYVADAVAEISTGAQFAHEFNITSIGFAHVIAPAKVRQAHGLVTDAHNAIADSTRSREPHFLDLEETKLILPNQPALVQALQNAKASLVVGGGADKIIANLSGFLAAEIPTN